MRSPHAIVLSAVFLLVSTGSPSWAALSVNKSDLLQFIGASAANSPAGKLVFASNGGQISYCDLKETELKLRTVTTRSVEARSLFISPDGNYITWVSGGRIVVARLEESTSQIIEFGKNGSESRPSWIRDEKAGKWYLVYADGNSTTSDHVAQEIGLSPLRVIGAPIKLFSAPTFCRLSEKIEITGPDMINRNYDGKVTLTTQLKYDGRSFVDTTVITDSLWVWAQWAARSSCGTARIGGVCTLPATKEAPRTFACGVSADGRYFGALDAGHGTVEIANPGMIGGTTIKNYVFYSSYYGYNALMVSGSKPENYDSRKGGYCNGHLSPAGPGHPLYGCVLHTGGNHTEIYVRRFPSDLTKEKPYIKTFMSFPTGGWFVEPSEDVAMIKSPKGEFRGVFAANPWFVCVIVEGDGNRPRLYSMANRTTPAGIVMATDAVAAFHAWLPMDYTPPSATAVTNGSVERLSSRPARKARITLKDQVISTALDVLPGTAVLTLCDERGAIVRDSHQAGSSPLRLSLDGLPAGLYVASLNINGRRYDTMPVVSTGRRW